MTSTATPSAELADENFNHPSQERTVLLERLHNAIHADVPVHFWAACHFCDIDIMTHLTNTVERDSNIVLAMALMMHFMVAGWDESRSMVQPEWFELATSTAIERDGSHCVLTGMGVIETAFIYPPCMMDPESADAKFGDYRPPVLDLLCLFFTQAKVAAWKRVLDSENPYIGGTGEATSANFLCLNPLAHALWVKGIFALKPVSISKDKKALTMQFFWQPPFKRPLAYYDKINILTIPPSTQHINGVAEAWLENAKGKRIESGQEFIIVTDDPIRRLLPSFELLEIQWFIRRVLVLAGRARTKEELEHCRPTYGDTSDEEEEEEEEEEEL
jgi:hypothetical protein